jgi:HEAT repeat protein
MVQVVVPNDQLFPVLFNHSTHGADPMTCRAFLIAVAAFCSLAALRTASAAQADDVLPQLERIAAKGNSADGSLSESVAEGIEKNPAAAATALLARLKDKGATETQLVVYVWALGLTKDRAAGDAIVELHRQTNSNLIRRNCLRALGMIGGKPAGECLLATLDTTTDKAARFEILNLLGQMQYEPALPKTEEVLKQDPAEFYWQSIFVFGKMGDAAVPFLLAKIDDKDRNVRANAINVLGTWLIPPEAAKPLQEHFWAETDPDTRGVILSSLEATVADFARIKTAFEQVAAKEKDPKLIKYAEETLGNIEGMKSQTASLKQKKQVSAEAFQREYAQLFRSAGRKGDYDALLYCSTVEDEPKLKSLRERILQRDSDEAFYDYQKINGVIVRNRMLKGMDSKTGPP